MKKVVQFVMALLIAIVITILIFAPVLLLAQKIEFTKVDTTTTYQYTRDSVYITQSWPCGYQWDPEAVDLKIIYRSRKRAIKNKTNGTTRY
jgi:hypothetical protein